jgi:hypothetical protein
MSQADSLSPRPFARNVSPHFRRCAECVHYRMISGISGSDAALVLVAPTQDALIVVTGSLFFVSRDPTSTASPQLLRQSQSRLQKIGRDLCRPTMYRQCLLRGCR